MKREQHNLHDVLQAFVNEEHHEEATRWLYPWLNVAGKKQAKQVWEDGGTSLTPEVFEKVCAIIQNQTGIDILTNKNKTKDVSFAKFLVCYALYYEFVTTKKITLNDLCSKYMPWFKHSQILYGVKSVEKQMNNSDVVKSLTTFSESLRAIGLTSVWQRLFQKMKSNSQVEVQSH